jgi:DNA-directed RNA polymerase subunit RPC12/RpoP
MKEFLPEGNGSGTHMKCIMCGERFFIEITEDEYMALQPEEYQAYPCPKCISSYGLEP